MDKRETGAYVSLKSITFLRNHHALISFLGILGLTIFVTFIVFRSAWISEDCFITLRYVKNTLNGYGAVFNVGEYVQGYTHPLWYLMLVVGSYILNNEILTAIVLGLLLTIVHLLIFGLRLFKYATSPLVALVVFAIACSSFISSDAWVSFQTGGLENALSHLLILLIISEAYYYKGKRIAPMLLLISLLCLSRPDYFIFSLPFLILVLHYLRSFRKIGTSIIAVLPSIFWLFFAQWYYGSPLPNTGMAKLGIYPDWQYSVKQGILYLIDWCISEPLPAAFTSVFLIYCAIASRASKVILVTIIGTFMHIAWVIFIGGDFMRGRFLTPILTASIIIWSFVTIEKSNGSFFRIPYVYCFISSILIISIFQSIGNALDWHTMPRWGILNERKFYPGYSFRNYMEEGHVKNPYLDLTFANDLRAYAEVCGPITVHFRNPGTIGYFAGPKVSIIDMLGLTDKFISNLPKTYLINPFPRPGHPDKFIPVSYLALRNDIALLPDWQKGIRERDCSLIVRVAQFRESTQYWNPNGIVNLMPSRLER